MRILISTTFNNNMAESKIKPLVLSSQVEHIFYVTDRPGPFFKKVKYYFLPERLLKFFNNNSFVRWLAKFFIILYLAIFKRPDLLMGYSLVPHGITVVLIGRMLGIPSCVNIIGGSFGIEGGGFGITNSNLLKKIAIKNSLLERILLKIADGCNFFIVTGTSTRNFLISKGIDKKKINILSAVADIKRFFQDCSKKQYDLITIAELIPRKRINVFLEIIAALVKKNFKIKALVLGNGILNDYLRRLSKQMGLQEVVQFLGFASEVEEYLHASKIFLFPTEKEGLSLAMLEAMACGVVPVVSNVDDLNDAVKDNINGRLIDKDDIDGFVSAVSELLNDPEKYSLYSSKAVDYICENYTIEHASKKWEEILRSFAAKKNANAWYFKRLKVMSVFEIWHRLTCIVKLKFLRLKYVLSDKNIYRVIRKVNRKGVFFIDKNDIGFIRENFPEKGARKYNEWPADGESIDWHDELRYANDIERRAGFYRTEIKDAWELNKFQWVVGYAQQYALENDEKIAARIVAILKDWIGKNPAMKGVNWMDSSEISLRLLSWAWIYFLIKDSKEFDKDFESMFLKNIYFQAGYVESNLSRYSSANNHLISQAAGLFVTGILFSQLKDADRWLKKGKVILEKEIKKQVYADGVSKEQSTHYHTFVADLYLIAVIIGRKNKVMFSKETYSRLEKMCGFLTHIVNRKGIFSSIGDSDYGVSVKLDIRNDTANSISVLNTAAIVFNRDDFKRNESSVDDKSLWLAGREGYAKYSRLKIADIQLDSKGFLDSGYYILRSKDLFVSFDCGPLGYLSLAAHGHADSLGVTLSVADTPILVDPGTYLYHSGDKWRDYFRSTMAHNTVRIDMLDQSEMTGPFLWGYKAKSYLKYWSPDRDIDKICGYHKGYTRLKDPVTHERELTLDKLKGEIIIRDSIFAKGGHLLEQFFHMHPDCALKQISGNVFEISSAKTVLFIEFDKALNISILNGSEEPICGWYSEKFGEKIETFTFRAENYFTGNRELITKISTR
nr:heparinase II/III family protein [Candidatus Omnitrophota bacterium]